MAPANYFKSNLRKGQKPKMTITIMHVSIMPVSIMPVSIMPVSIMPVSIMPVSIMPLRMITLFDTLNINETQHICIKCHYAECQVSFIVMLDVIML